MSLLFFLSFFYHTPVKERDSISDVDVESHNFLHEF